MANHIRRTPEEADELRARALCGNTLATESDATREWIWRSLLKGIRLSEACRLAGISLDQVDPILVEIRRLYQQRCQTYLDKMRGSRSSLSIPMSFSPTPPHRISGAAVWALYIGSTPGSLVKVVAGNGSVQAFRHDRLQENPVSASQRHGRWKNCCVGL